MFCAHRYPHNQSMAPETFAKGLKGTDLVLYSVFKSLNLDVKVGPILRMDELEGGYGISEIPISLLRYSKLHNLELSAYKNGLGRQQIRKGVLRYSDINLKLVYEDEDEDEEDKVEDEDEDEEEEDEDEDDQDDLDIPSLSLSFEDRYKLYSRRKVEGIDATKSWNPNYQSGGNVLVGKQFYDVIPLYDYDAERSEGDDMALPKVSPRE